MKNMGLKGLYTLKLELTMGYKQAIELKQYLKEKYGAVAVIEKKDLITGKETHPVSMPYCPVCETILSEEEDIGSHLHDGICWVLQLPGVCEIANRRGINKINKLQCSTCKYKWNIIMFRKRDTPCNLCYAFDNWVDIRTSKQRTDK